MARCYSYDRECNCIDWNDGIGTGNAVGDDWRRRATALLRPLGLHYMNDPGGGGFYNAAGRRVLGDSMCPEETHEQLAKLFAETQKPPKA